MPGDEADRSIGGAETLWPEEAPLGRIDQYELIRELGGGGLGTVFLARDTVAGIDVAVKGLPLLVKNNAEELERIRENFALVSKLHDRYIAAALVLHPAKEVSYADERVRQLLRVMPGDTLMVMAYAPGVTLNKWRKQFPDGKVPVDQALEVCRQIAAALDYAHGEKVVHRDVKPSNVMVETREEVRGNREEVRGGGTSNAERPTPNAEVVVRVLDFGLAAEIRSSMSRVSQEKGDTSGTRPYMAPEQWEGKPQDGRTDQYALAALFYELVSGAVPFASAFGTGDPGIMQSAVLSQKPELAAELSKTQNAVLLRGLAKEPGERFATCGELVAALGGGRPQPQRAQSPGGKKALLWVCVAVAAALGYGAYWTYGTYADRRAKERAAAEQAAAQAVRLDATQKAKVVELKAAAEAALATGDLETAGLKIAELKSAVGPTLVSADLQKKYESKAGERETNKRYATASVAKEKAAKLGRGQGFGAKLDALELTWREAEGARQGQGWGQALSGYDAVLAACKSLEREEASRGDAETRRGEAQKAKEEGVRAEAAKDAKDIFEAGGRGSTRAAELFEKGSFAEAAKAWQEAAASYASAKTRALAAQAYAKAKSAFESEIGGSADVSAVLLEKHSGAKWTEVKRLQKLGEASAKDPAAGADAYKQALAALPGAVTEAQAAERAGAERLAAEKRAQEEKARQEKLAAALAAASQAKAAGEWQACLDRAGEALALEAGNVEAAALKAEAQAAERAEAERLAAEKRAQEEKARQEKLAAALAAARQAKAAGGWQTCADRAGEALALEAGNAEAAALKAEAARNLMPTLTVECEVVGAQVSDGRQTYGAPHTFTLRPDASYRFAVTGPSGDAAPDLQGREKRRYKPATLEITADWLGPKTRRVALEEQRGPAEGEMWASPATGMAFVWVPALKLWVGKYEVTNGEYRKKDPNHNSKDFKGYTLNEDRQPVVRVNFNDAKTYAEWLTERDLDGLDGLQYRVISEQKWQTCAQCGDGREYPWGNSMPPKYGNYSDSASAWENKIDGYTDGYAVTCLVEKSGANEWGLYGLGGNVWECCASDASDSSFGALRGASWYRNYPDYLRCATRNVIDGAYRSDDYGFRLVLSR